MCQFLYYNYYNFAKTIKENVSTSIFYNTSLDAVILLSQMEFLNLVSLGIWLNIPHITTSYNLDMILLGIGLLSFNTLYFLRKKRYMEILEKYRKMEPSKKLNLSLITIAYSLLSYLLFFMAHSSI
jgi:hypothetical protein